MSRTHRVSGVAVKFVNLAAEKMAAPGEHSAIRFIRTPLTFPRDSKGVLVVLMGGSRHDM
jgi:hypothetical protein